MTPIHNNVHSIGRRRVSACAIAAAPDLAGLNAISEISITKELITAEI